jgi:hypothetical protein
MTNDKMQVKVNDQPEQAKPELIGQQAQQNQTSTAAELGQRAAQGRRPLFRN